MAKSKKPRPSKYDPKLAINGTFADVIKVSVSPSKQAQEQPKKDKKK